MTNKEARTEKCQSPEGNLRFEFVFNQAPGYWAVGGREKELLVKDTNENCNKLILTRIKSARFNLF